MGLDVNELFDVQRNALWEKRSVDFLALKNSLAPRVKSVMRLLGWGCGAFSQQYDNSAAAAAQTI